MILKISTKTIHVIWKFSMEDSKKMGTSKTPEENSTEDHAEASVDDLEGKTTQVQGVG